MSAATSAATRSTSGGSPIQQRFAALEEQGRCGLMPFLVAGDPDLAATGRTLLALQEQGADVIELGIPYSDPLADGPVIQAAAGRALAAGTTPAAVLELLASLRGRLTIPVVLFTYTNPLLNLGMETFCHQAAAAGAAGLVVPDLPLEEAERLSPIAAAEGLDLVLLVDFPDFNLRIAAHAAAAGHKQAAPLGVQARAADDVALGAELGEGVRLQPQFPGTRACGGVGGRAADEQQVALGRRVVVHDGEVGRAARHAAQGAL